jgi:hypothetical protein
MYDTLETLVYGDRVLIGSEGGDHDGPWVKKVEGAKYQTTLFARSIPVDVLPQLVGMWGIPEVTAYYARTPGAKKLPPSRKEREAAAMISPVEQAQTTKGDPMVPTFEQSSDAVIRRLKEKAAAFEQANANGDSSHAKNGKPR